MTELDVGKTENVLRAIDDSRAQLLEFLGEYVRFRSVNPEMLAGGEPTEFRKCQEWLHDALRAWEVFDDVELLAIDPEQPNVVARRRGAGGGRALLFNGHSDVVPVTDDQAQAWSTSSPWSGEVVDGRLWGRGASDMKGGNAAFLWAIKALAESGVRLRGDLIATTVAGEETGNHAVGVDLLRPAGYAAPFAILSEPTDLRICPASVGEFYFLVRVEGLSASLASRHRAVYPGAFDEPVAGVNAIDKMFKIQRALAELERDWSIWPRHPLMEPGNMSINFSRIHGGNTYSAMADSCELTGSVLFNPSLPFAAVRAEFTAAIEGVVQSDYWLREHRPSITIPYILDEKGPIDLARDHPGCGSVARACERVLGEPATLACTTGTNDGAYLFAQGQDLLTFGPGSSAAGVHGPNEYVESENVVRAAKVYAVAALDWCEAIDEGGVSR